MINWQIFIFRIPGTNGLTTKVRMILSAGFSPSTLNVPKCCTDKKPFIDEPAELIKAKVKNLYSAKNQATESRIIQNM